MQLDTAYRRRKRRHDGPSSLLAPSTGCPIERPRRLRRLLPKRLADAEALVSARLMGHEVQGQTFGNYSDGLAFQGLKKLSNILIGTVLDEERLTNEPNEAPQ